MQRFSASSSLHRDNAGIGLAVLVITMPAFAGLFSVDTGFSLPTVALASQLRDLDLR